jgi:tellurite resistance protein TerC
MSAPIWVWPATIAVIGALLAADFALTRSARSPRPRTALIMSGVSVTAGLAFGAVVWVWRGAGMAGQYYAAYGLEKTLSVDNLFVFVLVFSSLGVPERLQRRALFLGVIGALAMRATLIVVGGALIADISWVFYLFGALVLGAGLRMCRGHAQMDPSSSRIVRAARRLLPITNHYMGERLVARVDSRVMATPLLVAVVAIEAADLVFAIDSIPAVFGVTRDVYLVFASNAFAVIGLRSLYFLLADSVTRFEYLKQGVAVLLVLVGVKMLLSPVVHIPTWVTLAAIVIVLGASIVASLQRAQRRDAADRVNVR